MAHFAEIDKAGMVLRVVVTDNEMPKEGADWLKKKFGGTWIKTSYNTQAGVHALGGTPLRKNYAGIGFSYDSERDAFIPPKVFDSWLLDEETCLWVAPIPEPEAAAYWDEETLNWILLDE